MTNKQSSRFVLVIKGNAHLAAALLEEAGFEVEELRSSSRVKRVFTPTSESEEEVSPKSG